MEVREAPEAATLPAAGGAAGLKPVTAPMGDRRLSRVQVVLALALLVLAWSGTALFTLVAIEVCAGRSAGLEGQYLLMVIGPVWAAAVITGINCALYGWRWPWVLYVALAIGAPAFVFLRGCVAFARWWLS
jgi:hypothetical protein